MNEHLSSLCTRVSRRDAMCRWMETLDIASKLPKSNKTQKCVKQENVECSISSFLLRTILTERSWRAGMFVQGPFLRHLFRYINYNNDSSEAMFNSVNVEFIGNLSR